MRLRWKPAKKKSIAQNASVLLPLVYDRFMGRSPTVVDHPRRKKELHRMRIDGKPLRYAMETYESCFGAGYRECFEEVKGMLELMGSIHDLDVAIPRLREYLGELRTLNAISGKKVRTSAVSDLIAGQSKLRDTLFREFCARIDLWKSGDFRRRLIRELRPVSRSTGSAAPSGRIRPSRTPRNVP